MTIPRGLPSDWWAPQPIHFATATTDQVVLTRPARLYGFTFEETTGTATAGIGIIDGSSAAGQPVANRNLLANQSFTDWFGKPGLKIQSGIYVRFFSGSVRGTLYVLPMSDEEILRQEGYRLAAE